MYIDPFLKKLTTKTTLKTAYLVTKYADWFLRGQKKKRIDPPPGRCERAILRNLPPTWFAHSCFFKVH